MFYLDFPFSEPLPDHIDWEQRSHEAFLQERCDTYYGQGLEDALKAKPPLYPDFPEYMDGYNSLGDSGHHIDEIDIERHFYSTFDAHLPDIARSVA